MAIFLYFIYKEKWPKMGLKIAIKWPKTLQMTGNFDQTCISMSFIKFQKILGKFSKLADFWPKNDHLARFSRRDFETFFRRKSYQGLQKCSDLAKIGILVAYYVFKKSYLFLLDNFKFCWFYMRSKLSRGPIFVKIG